MILRANAREVFSLKRRLLLGLLRINILLIGSKFYLSAGCDVDDCTRYASSFEIDEIDETILSNILDQSMRSLGLQEGDTIRAKKAIAQKVGLSATSDEAIKSNFV